MTNRGKFAILIIIAVLVAVLFFTLGRGGNPASAPAAPGTSLGNDMTPTNTQELSAPNATGSDASSALQTKAAPATPIQLITPVSNDQWKFGQSNPISWNHEAGVTGEIDLLNAQTHALVGIVLSEIGPHQTSYSWDTRQIYLARYNPLKKDVTPGTYMIRIKFDGNNLPTLTSPAFTISQ